MQVGETIVESNEPATVADEPKTEPEGEVAEAKPEGEQVAASVETPEQQEAKKQSKFQRRLDRHKAAAIEAQTEARLLRERIAALEAAQAPKEQDGEPKQEQFEDYNAYVKALARYEAKQEAAATLKAESEKSAKSAKQETAQQSERKIAEGWVKREREFEAATEDYKDVVTPFVEEELGTFSEGARRLLVESEVGPGLLYHLAKNPDDVERISELSPMRQIVELGKMEDKMQRPAKAVSKAPEPITPVPAGISGSKDPSKMSISEYKAFMKANGSRYVR